MEHIKRVAPRGEYAAGSLGATSYIVHICVPLVHEATRRSTDLNGTEKAQFKSMSLEAHYHMLRPGELSNHNRRIDDLTLVGMPKAASGYGCDGLVKYLILRFRSHKTAVQASAASTFKVSFLFLTPNLFIIFVLEYFE
jgi:hypothetical protein